MSGAAFPVLKVQLEPLFALDSVVAKPKAPSDPWELAVIDRLTGAPHMVTVFLAKGNLAGATDRLQRLLHASSACPELLRIDDAYVLPVGTSKTAGTAVVVSERTEGHCQELFTALHAGLRLSFQWFDEVVTWSTTALRQLHSTDLVHGGISLEALCVRSTGGVVLGGRSMFALPPSGASQAGDWAKLRDALMDLAQCPPLARCSAQCLELLIDAWPTLSRAQPVTPTRPLVGGQCNGGGILSPQSTNLHQRDFGVCSQMATSQPSKTTTAPTVRPQTVTIATTPPQMPSLTIRDDSMPSTNCSEGRCSASREAVSEVSLDRSRSKSQEASVEPAAPASPLPTPVRQASPSAAFTATLPSPPAARLSSPWQPSSVEPCKVPANAEEPTEAVAEEPREANPPSPTTLCDEEWAALLADYAAAHRTIEDEAQPASPAWTRSLRAEMVALQAEADAALLSADSSVVPAFTSPASPRAALPDTTAVGRMAVSSPSPPQRLRELIAIFKASSSTSAIEQQQRGGAALPAAKRSNSGASLHRQLFTSATPTDCSGALETAFAPEVTEGTEPDDATPARDAGDDQNGSPRNAKRRVGEEGRPDACCLVM